MPTYQRLQQYAIAISVASIVYNGLEGGLSIGFGSESDSRSLVFFGIQSGIEVAASIIVVWRFRTIAKPGEEAINAISDKDLRLVLRSTSSTPTNMTICAVWRKLALGQSAYSSQPSQLRQRRLLSKD